MARKNLREPKGKVVKRWRYFFINDKLHKLIRLNRGRDEVLAWSYPDRCKVVYTWSVVKKYGEPGKRNKEVAEMLNRHHITLLKYLSKDWVPKPPQTYKIPDGEKPGIYIWSKRDIMRALDHAASINKGWKRADGFINAPNLPTPSEVRAETDYNMRLYAQGKDGKLVRVWIAEESDF